MMMKNNHFINKKIQEEKKKTKEGGKTMKTIGIVRKIDDLGRIVIPKEIRRTFRIKEGDPFEIYTDHEGEIIFKKYSPIGDLAETATQYAEAVNKACGISMIIVDRDIAVACAGVPKKDILEHKITSEMDGIIDTRQLYTWRSGEKRISVVERQEKYAAKVITPIFLEWGIIGAVAVVETDTMSEPTETELKLVQTAAAFLGKQLDS